MNSEFYHTSPSQQGGPMAIMLALIVGVVLLVGALVVLAIPLG